MHHFNEDSLAVCFHELDGRKAVGIDGMTKSQYGNQLAENLRELVTRMRRMAYRPGPVRQVQIPKEGKPGSTRPLGISNFEDKLVQKMVHKTLESIYEPLFLNCSYGFRPNRGCHDAIKGLHHYLYANQVETILDIDLANYFGSIDHAMLEAILRRKIKDQTFMRYIIRLFKAGVLSADELTISEEGVSQGSVCSPILANIFAHYVIDEWFENTVKKHCHGKVEIFRYADDMVICCQYQQDANRIRKAFTKRLERFKLTLNQEKTREVSFSKRRFGSGERQGSFDFLGFTFHLGRSRQGGVIPKLRTSGKRFRAKLKRVTEWAKEIRHKYKLRQLWKIFCRKLAGHIRYYGVSFNFKSVSMFIHQAKQIIFKWLNRRGDKKSFSWESFNLFLDRYPLPQAKIYHTLI